jgi:hypothetical protein
LRVEGLEAKLLLHGTGTLSGSVFFDVDGDGVRDASELGVPGIVVRLAASGGTETAMEQSAITDNDGVYTFDELEPGTYQISKRQAAATIDGTDTTSVPGAVSGVNLLSNVALDDDQSLGGNDFAERSLRPEFISIAWFFASSPPAESMLRETIALGEERAGEMALATSIRAGGSVVPDDTPDTHDTPVATDDVYTTHQDEPLAVNAASGVLANDNDPDGQTLTANLFGSPANGSVTLNPDGSFSYTPDAGFSGNDSFTYRASNGAANSNLATVRISVTAAETPNQLFGTVTPGDFDAAGLLGIRTDLVPGAPPITATHVDGDIDYTGYSNPPTYGNHHGSDPGGTDSNPGITPRPTGIYTTEQPDEDLVHNLEHGHVWISYNPSLISDGDLTALEQLVRDGSPEPNGGGVGVILTPRAANDSAIALASWAHLLTLDEFDAATIRSFVETNRGKAPEGFITP